MDNRKSFMKPLLLSFILVVTLLSNKSIADNKFSAAILVNDSIVSRFELSQRIMLLQILKVEGDLKKKAIDELINYKLLKELSFDYGLSATDEQIQQDLKALAMEFNLSEENFVIEVIKLGLAKETIEMFIKNRILLNQIVQYKFSNRADINSDEIDSYILNGSTTVEVNLSEIVLPFNYNDKDEIYNLAKNLKKKILEGVTFEGIAKQYSYSPSSKKGGSIGWVPIDKIPENLGNLLLTSNVNTIIGPTIFQNFIILYKFSELREIPLFPETSMILDFVELTIPKITKIDFDNLLLLLDDNNNCLNLEFELNKYAKFKDKLVRVTDNINNIPKRFYKILKNLDAGEGDLILNVDNSKTAELIMLCSRQQTISESDRALAKQYLFTKRLASLADGFLADIRAQAKIVYK